ncbi:FecCD family ABC transporter permease [Treponema pedis]|uniref:FecCD family ABC transporter permease n=1 Tax=Treponema pedis TaxID=409322 RepID=UPI0003F4CBEB|nr:iron ABC transporter permease [Treponema pedis]
MKQKYKVFLTIIPIAAILLSLMLGRYFISFSEILRIVLPLKGGYSNSAYNVFINIRFPRTLFVFISGGVIAVSGTSLQSIFRNPLASPDIIGVSSGASLGAALAIVIFHASPFIVQVFAFAGGCLAVILVLQISNINGEHSLIRLVLAGIIINAIAGSCVSIIKYTADPMNELPSLEFWLMGCFNIITWRNFIVFLPIVFVGCGFIFLYRRQLNILSLGDEEAASLGVSVKKIRLLFIGSSTLLVAVVVSAAGIISWIGLIAPHIVRLLFGNNNDRLVPFSFICGASLLLVADTFARSITGGEIPISIITALIGAAGLASFMSAKKRVGYEYGF